MFKLDLEKAKEPEIKLLAPIGLQKKQESSRKASTSASLTMLKCLIVWITINCGKFLKEMGIPDHLTYLLRKLCASQQATVRTEHRTTDWFKMGKECVKAVYCHPVYLTYTHSTLCQMLDWMNHKLESRLPGKISITSDTQMIPPLWHKVKRN